MSNVPVILDVYTPGTLFLAGVPFQCALGPAGIVLDKREGDGGSPVGAFPLRRVLYRPDRLEPPETLLPVYAISDRDGWCDDPTRPEYNQHIILPHVATHERLWRDDHIYDVIVEVGYNDNPPVSGKGSAIFMHVARAEYAPTQGCVALQLDDLLRVLRVCGPAAVLQINPPA
ncbi:MAG: L,D-transpeptidase family protein [Rhodospirillales bacterium]|nr:L,D-transpeptidase family protein [Rhodospirillales bacterium]